MSYDPIAAELLRENERLRAENAKLRESMRDEVLAEFSLNSTARREWRAGSAWLWPGDSIVVVRAETLPEPKP